MRRIALVALLLGSVSVLAILGTGASDGGGGDYKVRAIFDNAVSVIPGEDVKIAGVKVGRIDSLDITNSEKAAVVLDITESGFQDFRQDATCTIRPQSLIGEKFVECMPTQPRQDGQPKPPALQKVDKGRGTGQYLLPLSTKYGGGTQTPVDIDLINNVFRLPYAQRFSLILNEFGAGVAGRGTDLNQAIKRANPAFYELDKVLAILAKQNKTLADLARDSDTSLAPLARDRRQIGDFIDQSSQVAAATAEKRVALERQFELLPTFLRELRPTLSDTSKLAGAMTPVLNDLRAAAPDLNKFIEQLGPFATVSIPAFQSLGDAADVGSEALPPTDPLITLLRTFAKPARNVGDDLAATLVSLQKTGGIERVLDFLFYTVTAVNGYDTIGHYLRAGLIVNTCSTYAIAPVGGCSANFVNLNERNASAAAANDEGRDPRIVAGNRVLRGENAADVLAQMGLPSVTQEYSAKGRGEREGDTAATTGDGGTQGTTTPSTPKATTPSTKDDGGDTASDQPTANDAAANEGAQNGLFDYLLGGEGK
jgi:phospholipid/cholesterol/gamma-HCH transport system substrate-binding protein